MFTIKNNITNEIIINKSRFIGKLFKINSKDEVDNILKSLKHDYKDATHYTFAYIIGNTKRFNDDGEPSGTAGIPILNVLENNNLDYILCVVIRYFGGIKLGAGGLVRAYSKCCSSCIKASKIIELIEGYEIELSFTYEQIKIIEKIIFEKEIVDKTFKNSITFKLHISIDRFNEIKNIIELENIKYTIKNTLLVSK